MSFLLVHLLPWLIGWKRRTAVANRQTDYKKLYIDIIDCVSRDEVVQVLNEVKTGKVPRPSVVSLELMVTSREVGIQVLV